MKTDGDLRRLFRRSLPAFDWTTVETGLVTPGVPDSNACIDGIELWIEFKRTSHWLVSSLDPLQVAWIHRRYRHGGRVWVAVRRHHEGGSRRGPPVDELWLVPGSQILELAAVGLRTSCIWNWSGGPGLGGWPWTTIGRLLIGREA